MSVLEIINIIFVAETSACFGLLYFLCLDEGMILSFIGNILLKEQRLNEEIKIHNEKELEYIEELRRIKKEIKIPKWKKPLGACQTCTMVWIGVFTYILYLKILPLFVLISVVSNGLLIFRKIA